MSLQARKTALRQELLARRAAVGRVAREAASAALCAALEPFQGARIAGYVPIRGEADPLPALAAARGPVALPVIVAAQQPLRFRQWHPGAPLVAARFGTQIPPRGDWMTPDIVIVPLLGFDGCGGRLGYGGGFYDRTLELLRQQGQVQAIGFALEAQRAEIPLEPTDQPLDMIVTEQGALRL